MYWLLCCCAAAAGVSAILTAYHPCRVPLVWAAQQLGFDTDQQDEVSSGITVMVCLWLAQIQQRCAGCSCSQQDEVTAASQLYCVHGWRMSSSAVLAVVALWGLTQSSRMR